MALGNRYIQTGAIDDRRPRHVLIVSEFTATSTGSEAVPGRRQSGHDRSRAVPLTAAILPQLQSFHRGRIDDVGADAGLCQALDPFARTANFHAGYDLEPERYCLFA